MRRALSASELNALVLKAARGAGLPLGAAEDLARVAPVLAQVNALADLTEQLCGPFPLPRIDDGVLRNGHPTLTELAALDLDMAQVSHSAPNLWPAFATALRTDLTPTGPFELSADLYEHLDRLAAKTYVPETDASRLSGAGAGLTDND